LINEIVFPDIFVQLSEKEDRLGKKVLYKDGWKMTF